MSKPKESDCEQLKSIRKHILDSYIDVIKDSFQTNRSRLKLINYGTGSGKTHQLFQAIYKTIEKYPDIQTIGIYVAPLREHLSIPDRLKNRYSNIPVYKINSLDMKTTNYFIDKYKKWIPLILKKENIWKLESKKFKSKEIDEVKQNLYSILNIIKRLKFLHTSNLGDRKIQDNQIKTAKQDLTSGIENFLVFLINSNSDENTWSDECLKLMEIFFPLHLLRKKSGILMLTYDKFETTVPYFKYNGKKWIKKNEYLDKFVVQNGINSTKFILAFDEQEDGYQIMLKKKNRYYLPR